jgi:hypothetical protein
MSFQRAPSAEFIGPIQQSELPKFEILSSKRMKIDESGLDKFGRAWGIGRKVYVVSVKMLENITKYRKPAKSAKHAKKIVQEEVQKLFGWYLNPDNQPHARFRRQRMGDTKPKFSKKKKAA